MYPEFCLSGDRYEQEASAGEETEEQESSEMEAQTDGKKVVCGNRPESGRYLYKKPDRGICISNKGTCRSGRENRK